MLINAANCGVFLISSGIYLLLYAKVIRLTYHD